MSCPLFNICLRITNVNNMRESVKLRETRKQYFTCIGTNFTTCKNELAKYCIQLPLHGSDVNKDNYKIKNKNFLLDLYY